MGTENQKRLLFYGPAFFFRAEHKILQKRYWPTLTLTYMYYLYYFTSLHKFHYILLHHVIGSTIVLQVFTSTN